MLQRRASCTFAVSGSRRGQRGATALLLVLGTLAVLLAMGAIVATAIRQELRLSRVVTEAEQEAMLIESGYSEAAKLAHLSQWPAEEPLRGTICAPAPREPYPSYCIEPLAAFDDAGVELIPIRIGWRVATNGPAGEVQGWILREEGYVTTIVPYRSWCEPPSAAEFDPNVSLGVCARGN